MRTDIQFLLKIGVALQNLGMDASRLESALGFLASKLNIEADFFSTPTSLMVAINDGDHQQHYLKRTQPGGIHLEKLSRINEIGNDVFDNKISYAEALKQIEVLEKQPERYSKGTINFFFGLSASSVSLFLGGNTLTAALSFFLGLLVGFFMVHQEKLRLSLIADAVAALLVSLLAYLANFYFPTVDPMTMVLSSLLVIIPGVTLATAISEIASQHLSAGTARLMLSIIVFLKMAFGVALGIKIFGMLGLKIQLLSFVPEPSLLLRSMGLLVASFTLRYLFRAQPCDTLWITLSCFLAFLTFYFGQKYLGSHFGMLISSTTVTVISHLFSKVFNRPILITLLPGILVLVPGAVGFQSFNYLYQHDLLLAIDAAFTTLTMVFALVAGLFTGNLIFKTEQHF